MECNEWEDDMDNDSIYECMRMIKHYRGMILSPLLKVISMMERSLILHSCISICSIYLISMIYVHVKSLTLFSLHPTFMIIGGVVFLGNGIVCFQDKGLYLWLSPIMSNSKKNKLLQIHKVLQVLGSAFLFLGIMFILCNKVKNGYSAIPGTLHAWFGLLTMHLLVIQIIIGYRKNKEFTRTLSKVYQWHGDMGVLYWDTFCITMLSGFMEYMSISEEFWMLVSCVLCIGILWLNILVHMKRHTSDLGLHAPANSLENEENEQLLTPHSSSSSNSNSNAHNIKVPKRGLIESVVLRKEKDVKDSTVVHV